MLIKTLSRPRHNIRQNVMSFACIQIYFETLSDAIRAWFVHAFVISSEASEIFHQTNCEYSNEGKVESLSRKNFSDADEKWFMDKLLSWCR